MDEPIELKCPKASTHLKWLSMGVVPREHVAQVQGEIWVTGAECADFMSFHPGLPPLLEVVTPDPAYQDALDEHMPTFIEELLQARESLIEKGVQPFRAPERPPDPAIAAYRDAPAKAVDALTGWQGP